MIEEIIYTSAEKGLRQGSRGFCTVVSTAGMAQNLAERLESMSGYRHAFPLHDPRASLNPVNYSHVVTRLAGHKLHIISRVADAGQDYSGRSNKLAHHIVISDHSSLLAGPARLLGADSIVVRQWDGQVRTVPPRTLQSPAVPQHLQFPAWKKATGDAGWAGVVCEQLLASKDPLHVIFVAGADTYGLLCEVLDLLPGVQRWQITFSTYFTRVLAGTECQLRFVLADTPEATALGNNARARVVDLTSSLSAATGGALVRQARTGVSHSVAAVGSEAVPGATSPRRRTTAVTESDWEALSPESATYQLERSRMASRSGRAVVPPSLSDATQTRRSAHAPRARHSVGRRIIIGIVVILLIAVTTAAGIMLRKKMQEQDSSAIAQPTELQDEQDAAEQFAVSSAPPTVSEDLTAVAIEGTQSNPQVHEFGLPTAEQHVVQTAEDQPDSVSATPSSEQLSGSGSNPAANSVNLDPAPEVSGLTKPEQSPDPFSLIPTVSDNSAENRMREFLLPAPTETKPVTIPLILSEGDTVSLELVTPAPLTSTSGVSVAIEPEEEGTSWRQTLSNGTARLDEVGRYELKELKPRPLPVGHPTHELSFTWASGATARRSPVDPILWWQPLLVSVGEGKQRFALHQPIEVQGESLNALLKGSRATIRPLQNFPDTAQVKIPEKVSRGIRLRLVSGGNELAVREMVASIEAANAVVYFSGEDLLDSTKKEPSPTQSFASLSFNVNFGDSLRQVNVDVELVARVALIDCDSESQLAKFLRKQQEPPSIDQPRNASSGEGVPSADQYRAELSALTASQYYSLPLAEAARVERHLENADARQKKIAGHIKQMDFQIAEYKKDKKNPDIGAASHIALFEGIRQQLSSVSDGLERERVRTVYEQFRKMNLKMGEVNILIDVFVDYGENVGARPERLYIVKAAPGLVGGQSQKVAP